MKDLGTAIALAAFLVGGGGCSREATQPASDANTRTTKPSLPTPWVKLQKGPGTPLFEGSAQVLPLPGSIAEVMTVFSAQVTRILVQPGQRVAIGTPLCVVVVPEVLRAAGAYLGAGMRLSAYTQRKEQLAALRNEGLARQTDQLETEARLAEAKAAQLEALAVLQSANLGPSDAASLLANGGKITLRSPINGVVVSVGANLGNTVSPGVALLKIVGLSGQRIEARLAANLPDGVSFDLVLPSGKRKPLRLLERSPQVDGRDGTQLAWFVLGQKTDPQKTSPEEVPPPPTDDPDVVSGMWVKVVASVSEQTVVFGKAFVVPTTALKLTASGTVVLRRSGTESGQTVPVRVLWSSSVEALIAAAELAPNDLVAADARLLPGVGGSKP